MDDPRASDFGPIESLLARTRRRALSVSLGTGVCIAVASGIAIGGIAATVLGLLDPPPGEDHRFLATAFLALGATGALFIAWRYLFSPLRRFGGEAGVAVFLERTVPQAAGMASAVQFHRGSGDNDYSEALARAHVRRVAAQAHRVDPRPAVTTRPLTQAGIVLGIVASLHLLALFFFADTIRRGYDQLIGVQSPIRTLDMDRAVGIPELITGDVELTYRYPSYTRLPPRTVGGTGGDVLAFKGTEVEIRTRADRDVEMAEIVIGDTALPMNVTGKRQLEGGFVVSESGSYRFRFVDASRDPVAEGAVHKITIEPDTWPDVEASIAGEPTEELEVREQEKLVLVWKAKDDFGLTELSLVYRVKGGKPQTVPLEHGDERTRVQGRFVWELATLHLAPGDRVAWYIEAKDNDAISGPKAGTSITRYLKVFSASEHHRELMARVEGIWEAMLSSLADHLETPFEVADNAPLEVALPHVTAAKGLAAGLAKLHSQMNDVIDLLADDPLAPREFVDALAIIRTGINTFRNRLHANLRAFETRLRARQNAQPRYIRLVRRSHGDVVVELEKDILYLEDLLDRQRVRDIIAMTEEIQQHKRRLEELVDQLMENPTEEVRAQISEEISRIKQRIHELLEKMQELASSINDEYLNADAMAELRESQDLLSNLDEIQRLLNEGKLEEALQRLANMANQLENMLEQLRGREQDFGSEEYAELARQMGEFSDELQRVKRDQDHLLEKTSKLKDQYQKELEKRLSGKLDDLVKELTKEVEAAQRNLRAIPDDAVKNFLRPGYDSRSLDAALQHLKDTKMLLEARDFDEARKTAHAALRSTESLAGFFEDQRADALRLRGLVPQERSATFAEGRRRSDRANAHTRKIADELDKLFPDPQEVFNGQQRKEMARMGRAQEKLRSRTGALQKMMDEIGKQAPIFSPGMRQTLREAGGYMGEAGTRLGQSDARQATGQQKAALERLGQLQEQMAQAMRGGQGMPNPMSGLGRRGGGRGMRHERVEIPDADQYKPPEAFRKALLEAMKDGSPERYKQQVKRYYEELVR